MHTRGNAVGDEIRKEIEDKGYKRILSEVAPDGKISYKLLKDQEGKVFEIINL